MNCQCGQDAVKYEKGRQWVCFSCMIFLVETYETPNLYSEKILIEQSKMKRRGPADWVVGSNPQTTVNFMRSQELEKLFELWLARKILE